MDYRDFRTTERPSLWNVPKVVSKDDRTEVFDVLALTPIGREANNHYERLESKHQMKLKFVIEDQDGRGFMRPLDGPNAGTLGPFAGFTDDDPNGAQFPESLTVNIMGIPISSGDKRMTGWTREERIHIIAVHERHHVKKSGGLISNSPNDDFRDEPERGIVAKELTARFEYSIRYPERSTGNSGWLQNYISYFETRNKKNENPVWESYLHAITDLYDARELSLENYTKAVEQRDVTFLVK